MRNYIISFFEEFDYPKSSRTALLDCYDKTAADPEFISLTELYDKCAELNFHDVVMPALNRIAEKHSVHKFTLHLLYCIILSLRLRERYEEKNLPYEIYYDTMLDLKFKLIECEKMYSIEGTFVFWWFDRHFAVRLFGLGRLQFELSPLRFPYEAQGRSYPVGTKVINTHIPYGSPLKKELCIDSYNRAIRFFGDSFPESGPIPFVCDSWLLHPVNSELLGTDSNIVRFASDFTLLSIKNDPNCGDLWRLFLKEYHGKPEEMPHDTTLQKLYIKHLLSGGEVGTAYGIMLYQEGNLT